MLFFPPAKINIGLRILRKRSDGFHDVELSYFKVPSLCDILEITPDTHDSFVCEGLAIPGAENDNLILKARTLIDRRTNGKRPPCRIHLFKKIPMQSGLGGGSADAAYTLTGLNKTFQLGIPSAEIHAMAAELGADCAFFTQDAPCIGYGKGDILHPLSSDTKPQKFKLIVVVPSWGISTAEAYRNALPKEVPFPLEDGLRQDISQWKDLIENDFEKTLFPQFPRLYEIKQSLYEAGARYAALSGSGSALFGIFENNAETKPLKLPETCFIHQTDIQLL